jgi:spore protease
VIRVTEFTESELACERSGVLTERLNSEGFEVRRGNIEGRRVSSVTVPAEELADEHRAMCGVKALATEILRLMPPDVPGSNAPVTVICLGNGALTADSLGSLCAEGIIATRGLIKERADKGAKDGFVDCGSHRSACDGEKSLSVREVSVITAGVYGRTGIEACELARACIPLLKPRLIIAIDALRAVKRETLSRVIEVSDSGITPGSGAKNRRKALTEKALGVPVISVGAPTSISSGALVCDTLERAGLSPIPKRLSDILLSQPSLIVTPSDADARIKRHARLIARAVNLALIGLADT